MSDARIPEHTAMEVVQRLLDEMAEGSVDRVLIIAVDHDGDEHCEFSNARSEYEHKGMLHGALFGKDAD